MRIGTRTQTKKEINKKKKRRESGTKKRQRLIDT